MIVFCLVQDQEAVIG